MTDLPPDVREIAGLEGYGISRDGQQVFFGFNVRDTGRVMMRCTAEQLDQCIAYLQTIAKNASDQRANPAGRPSGADQN